MPGKKVKTVKSARGLPWLIIAVGSSLLIFGVASAFGLLKAEGQLPRTGDQAISVTPIQVEFPVPELKLQDLDGNPVSLADYQGQVILVNNWATWCPPCKAEMPTLQTYYEAHKNQNFVLIAIEAGDPAPVVLEFVRKYELSFPVWLDAQTQALAAFHNDALPSSYVIDRQGIVRFAWTGAIDRYTLEKTITPLLEE